MKLPTIFVWSVHGFCATLNAVPSIYVLQVVIRRSSHVRILLVVVQVYISHTLRNIEPKVPIGRFQRSTYPRFLELVRNTLSIGQHFDAFLEKR